MRLELKTENNRRMAKYKPGESGNPVGRPKGAQNKDMIDLRAWIKNFTERNMNQIEKDFKLLKPAERCTLYVKLLEFVIPRKREEEITISDRDKFMKKFFGTGSVDEKDDD